MTRRFHLSRAFAWVAEEFSLTGVKLNFEEYGKISAVLRPTEWQSKADAF
ncbi:MAG: hypothetical protein M1318_05465 [Firmicutes bacterium]|jgi:hypothetical protein|nr:hypothetical protein [Bacillota bacterium]